MNRAGDMIPSRTIGQLLALPADPPVDKLHTAVWTGTEMIVWGGEVTIMFTDALSTGGRYKSCQESWSQRPTAMLQTSRQFHTTVWTGSEMIIWAGRG